MTLIPPPIICLICAMVMPYFPPLLTFTLPLSLTVALGVLALSLGMYCVWQFVLAKTTIHPQKLENTSTLVTTGIYRISRNPMYLSLAILLLAWACYLGTLGAIFGMICFIVYMNVVQIRQEEKMLACLFGERYQQYCQQTRRWL